MLRFSLALLIALTAVCGAGRVAGASVLEVEIILSENSAPYQQFAQTLQASAKTSIHFTVTSLPLTIRTKPDLHIALGLKALEALKDRKQPVIAALISSSDYFATTLADEDDPQSAVFMDQPKSRQLAFLRAVLPKTRSVGLLYSRQSLLELEKFRNAALLEKLELQTNFVSSAEDIFSSIEAIANKSDLLLAMPDANIFNGGNIRNILLTTYRVGLPLIGFSPGYVSAGAVAAIYSTSAQMAQDVASQIHKFDQSGDLPPVQYPSSFDIAVNQQVAKSLNIDLPSNEEIRSRMQMEALR